MERVPIWMFLFYFLKTTNRGTYRLVINKNRMKTIRQQTFATDYSAQTILRLNLHEVKMLVQKEKRGIRKVNLFFNARNISLGKIF